MQRDAIIEIDASQVTTEAELVRVMRGAMRKPTDQQMSHATVAKAAENWWRDHTVSEYQRFAHGA
jgi:hypothetical protein